MHVSLTDSMPVQRCIMFAVSLLSQQQEFYGDPSYLCFPASPQYSCCLYYAGTRHGRATEKGIECTLWGPPCNTSQRILFHLLNKSQFYVVSTERSIQTGNCVFMNSTWNWFYKTTLEPDICSWCLHWSASIWIFNWDPPVLWCWLNWEEIAQAASEAGVLINSWSCSGNSLAWASGGRYTLPVWCVFPNKTKEQLELEK